VSLAGRLGSALPEPLKEPARLFLARRLERRTRESSFVRGAALVIHAVGPVAGDRAREIDPPLSASRLGEWVSYLSPRYALVRASELLEAARARAPGERVPVALTFDDDLRSHLEHAAPVLARHGAAATAFLCGSDEPFWWHALQRAIDESTLSGGDLPGISSELTEEALARRPWAIARLARAIEELPPDRRATVTLVLSQLASDVPAPLGPEGARALLEAGWEIGFHTRRHDVLLQLDDASLARALHEGRERLPERPTTLAYPHGKAGRREALAARAAGYEAAFTGVPEVVTDSSDPHLIGRLQPNTTTIGRFALQLAVALRVPGGQPP
jgi:peptidoglycan/xylan/chitin deacetylase (PgdA/CDA1 family)